MNEVIVNTNEIESIWEKDHICFVKMKSGKVWLCQEYKDITTFENNLVAGGYSIKTKDYIAEKQGLVCLELVAKGKCERDG